MKVCKGCLCKLGDDATRCARCGGTILISPQEAREYVLAMRRQNGQNIQNGQNGQNMQGGQMQGGQMKNPGNQMTNQGAYIQNGQGNVGAGQWQNNQGPMNNQGMNGQQLNWQGNSQGGVQPNGQNGQGNSWGNVQQGGMNGQGGQEIQFDPNFDPNQNKGKKKKEKAEAPVGGYNWPVISIGQWLVTLLLTAIPIVNLVYILKTILNKDENPTKKNYLITVLIYFGIAVVLSIVITAVLSPMLAVPT